jgi:hypothetical protein
MTGMRLLKHDQLPAPLCELSPKYLRDLARKGKLGGLKPIRLTPYSEAVYSEDEVIRFLEAKAKEAEQ